MSDIRVKLFEDYDLKSLEFRLNEFIEKPENRSCSVDLQVSEAHLSDQNPGWKGPRYVALVTYFPEPKPEEKVEPKEEKSSEKVEGQLQDRADQHVPRRRGRPRKHDNR